MLSSSVHGQKSLQQLQEEVALNGLPPPVDHDSTHQTSTGVCKVLKSVQIVDPPAPTAANRTSNNTHQEIKIKVCIFYKKIKDTLCFNSFSNHSDTSRMLFSKIRICYITCTKIMLCVFPPSLKFFFCFFCLFNSLLCSFYQLSKQIKASQKKIPTFG